MISYLRKCLMKSFSNDVLTHAIFLDNYWSLFKAMKLDIRNHLNIQSFPFTLLYFFVFFLEKCLDDWKNSKKVVCRELTTLRATINLEKNLFLLSNPEHKYDQDEVPSIFSPLSLAAICNDCHLLLSKTKAIKRNARRMS